MTAEQITTDAEIAVTFLDAIKERDDITDDAAVLMTCAYLMAVVTRRMDVHVPPRPTPDDARTFARAFHVVPKRGV